VELTINSYIWLVIFELSGNTTILKFKTKIVLLFNNNNNNNNNNNIIIITIIIIIILVRTFFILGGSAIRFTSKGKRLWASPLCI